jgi:omega-hydroxy-beta-dihydromenaquinone-9 sulfotransferase
MRERPHDHVALDFGVPNEDEIALVNDSGLSPYLAWAFPRNAAFYDRFLTLREATGEEVSAWEASLLRFLKKLSYRYGRPLVLKSPPHTARIRLLLGLFPEARFFHIRRDPFEVCRSTRHMIATTMRYWRLQAPPGDEKESVRSYPRYISGDFRLPQSAAASTPLPATDTTPAPMLEVPASASNRWIAISDCSYSPSPK